MPRRGSWEMRNAAYKGRRAAELAAASTDAGRLAVAFDWFRSSAALLARRRVPRGYSQDDNRAASARLVREVVRYLAAQAQAIDRGDYDAGRR
jgi:hypothetical protein